jgi:hypothetical protein
MSEDWGLHHRNAGDTELAAAESMAPHTSRMQNLVLGLISASEDGLTDHELYAAAADVGVVMAQPAHVARRNELVRAGLVLDSGVRRMTPYHRKAIVWRAVGS